MQHTHLIDLMGGTNEVARLLEVQPPSVSGWKRVNQIPPHRLIVLAVLAELAGVVTRQTLFPETWERIWPELADNQAREQIHAQPSL